MERVAVIGSGGAGKSTFSRQLGTMTGLPVYHLDSLHWKPGWVPTAREVWDELMGRLVEKERWIIDGNYGRTMDARLQAADTIIYLDMPRYLCMYRIVKRRIMYHRQTRPDMTEGCPERLDLEFVKWVWNYHKNRRETTLQKLERLSTEKQVVILRNPREVKRFLDQVEKNKPH